MLIAFKTIICVAACAYFFEIMKQQVRNCREVNFDIDNVPVYGENAHNGLEEIAMVPDDSLERIEMVPHKRLEENKMAPFWNRNTFLLIRASRRK
jgi:hypothetical protein